MLKSERLFQRTPLAPFWGGLGAHVSASGEQSCFLLKWLGESSSSATVYSLSCSVLLKEDFVFSGWRAGQKEAVCDGARREKVGSYSHGLGLTHRQRHPQTDVLTHTHTTHTLTQTHTPHIDILTLRYTHRHTLTLRHTHTHTHSDTEIQTHTQRQTHTHRHTYTTHTDTRTHTYTQTHTPHTDTHTHTLTLRYTQRHRHTHLEFLTTPLMERERSSWQASIRTLVQAHRQPSLAGLWQGLCWSLEKAMAPHSSTLAWKIPWTEEPGRLQSMGRKESDTTEWLHFTSHWSYSSARGERPSWADTV